MEVNSTGSEKNILKFIVFLKVQKKLLFLNLYLGVHDEHQGGGVQLSGQQLHHHQKDQKTKSQMRRARIKMLFEDFQVFGVHFKKGVVKYSIANHF